MTATVQGKLAARKMLVVKDDLEEAYNQAWHGVCEKIKGGEKIENLTGMLVLVTWRRAVDIYRSNHPAEHEDVDVADRGIEPDLAAEIDESARLQARLVELHGAIPATGDLLAIGTPPGEPDPSAPATEALQWARGQ
ncbi:MAG TPA: hypothetical protein VK272_03265 [Solirubrobacteraceae bacterium]|nr:hypothetical protein [Solirubrobacteraceae bacterium]